MRRTAAAARRTAPARAERPRICVEAGLSGRRAGGGAGHGARRFAGGRLAAVPRAARVLDPGGAAMQRAVHAATTILPHLRRGLTRRERGPGRPRAAHADRRRRRSRSPDRDALLGLRRRRRRPPPRGRPARGARAGPRARSACTSSRGCACADPACPLRSAIVAPLRRPRPPRRHARRALRAARAACGWRSRASWPRRPRSSSAMVELSELEAQGERLARAELRALRAQISPHFIYNALAAVAAFIHSRPGGGARAADRVLRVHPLRVRAPAAVRDARRRAAVRREVPAARAGALRRAAARARAGRPRGAARRSCRCSRCSRSWRTRCATASSRAPEGGLVVDRGARPRRRRRAARVRRRRRDRPRARGARRSPAAGRASASATSTAGCSRTFGEGYGLRWSRTASGHDGRDDAAEVPRGGAAA